MRSVISIELQSVCASSAIKPQNVCPWSTIDVQFILTNDSLLKLNLGVAIMYCAISATAPVSQKVLCVAHYAMPLRIKGQVGFGQAAGGPDRSSKHRCFSSGGPRSRSKICRSSVPCLGVSQCRAWK